MHGSFHKISICLAILQPLTFTFLLCSPFYSSDPALPTGQARLVQAENILHYGLALAAPVTPQEMSGSHTLEMCIYKLLPYKSTYLPNLQKEKMEGACPQGKEWSRLSDLRAPVPLSLAE